METASVGLVGRQGELERVAEALADESVRGVALRGPAGAGKTRLAEECLRIADGLGFVTRRVLATPSATAVPLGAMAGLIPPLGDDVNPLGAALAALRSSGRGAGRLLLLVDDAQWLDDTSATLVLQVVSDGDAFAVLTIRDGEMLPPALAAMLRTQRLTQIEVGPLPDREIGDLVAALLGDGVDRGLVRRVVQLSAGSPLAAHEIVVGAVESGAIAHGADGWTIMDALERSSRVTDLVGERLGRLDERHRRALGMVALAEPLPMAWVPGPDLDSLGDLESAGLVTVDDIAGRHEIRIGHPLYGEVLRGSLSPLARRAHLQTVLDGAVGRDANEHDRLRLVVWALELGSGVAPDELAAAARRAFATHRIDLAARFLDAVPAEERSADQRYELMCALLWIGEDAAGTRLLEQMLTDPQDDRELARAVETEALDLQCAGEFDRAREALDRALVRVTDPDEATRLHVSQFANSIVEMSPPGVIDALTPVVESVVDDGLVSAGFVLALALNVTGRPGQAADVAHRTAVVHRRIWTEDPVAGFPKHPASTLVSLAFARACSGQLERAEEIVDEIRLYEDRTSSTVVQGHAESSGALNALLAGRLSEAVERYTAAGELFDRTVNHLGARSLLSWALGTLARAQSGDGDGAAEALAHVEDARYNPMFDALVPLARGWCAVAQHRSEDADEHFLAAIDVAESSGARLFGLWAAWSMVRVGSAGRIPPVVLTWRDDLDGELLPAWLDGVRAAQRGDAAGLEAVAERLEGCGCSADAAEAFALASRLRADAGEPRHATADARRVGELLRDCPDVRTPGLVVTAEPVPLTRREREVAAMAAQGTPASVIAEELFISERTVTNHLQRVYDKLGVSSRSELRDALAPGGA